MNRFFWAIVALTFLAIRPCLAAEPGEEPLPERLATFGYTEPDVRAFLKKIQTAVQTDDAQALASMVQYPFSFNLSFPHKAEAKNKQAFVTAYRKFLDPRWKKAVMSQRYEDLFVNYKGISVHNGEVWFGGICKNKDCSEHELKILAFNKSSGD